MDRLPVVVMGHELGIEAELGEGLGQIEGLVGVLSREKLLRRMMRHRHRIDVIALAEKERHRGERERRERESRRERVARRRAEPRDGEQRQRADDDQRHHVVGCDADRLDDEVTLDHRRDRGDR